MSTRTQRCRAPHCCRSARAPRWLRTATLLASSSRSARNAAGATDIGEPGRPLHMQAYRRSVRAKSCDRRVSVCHRETSRHHRAVLSNSRRSTVPSPMARRIECRGVSHCTEFALSTNGLHGKTRRPLARRTKVQFAAAASTGKMVVPGIRRIP